MNLEEPCAVEKRPTINERLLVIYKNISEWNRICDLVHGKLTGMAGEESKKTEPCEATFSLVERLVEETTELRNKISALNKII